MTVQQLIDELKQLDSDKPVQIIGEHDGKMESWVGAISRNDSGRVLDFPDFVAITRII